MGMDICQQECSETYQEASHTAFQIYYKAVSHHLFLILPTTSVYSNQPTQPPIKTVTAIQGLMWGTNYYSLDLLSQSSFVLSVWQRHERLLTGASFSSCCCNTKSWQKQLQGGWLFCVHYWRKSWQQEPGAAGHIVLPAKKQRYSTSFLLCMQTRLTPLHLMAPPTFRMDPLASTNLIKASPTVIPRG